MDTNLVAKIERDIVCVLVDTTNDNDRHFYNKYADGIDHALILLVMDTDGKQLARRVGGECVDGDEGHYHISPASILKFLKSVTLKNGHGA